MKEGKFEIPIIKSSEIEYVKEIARGTYGAVYLGKWHGLEVAIKKLKPSSAEKNGGVSDFWREALILCHLRHPNIVNFHGVVSDGPVTDTATVTEFMVSGSLGKVLGKKDRTVDHRKRILIAMDISLGMEYLHANNIVHFDLKSENLLVNTRNPLRPVCKIGDLGLSLLKQNEGVDMSMRGTLSWMAPELLNKKRSLVTEKVDIYSFGVVMWELLTGERPYAKMQPKDIIVGVADGTLGLEIPSWCEPGWRSLMERCWSAEPDSRPSFSDIVKELQGMCSAMNTR